MSGWTYPIFYFSVTFCMQAISVAKIIHIIIIIIISWHPYFDHTQSFHSKQTVSSLGEHYFGTRMTPYNSSQDVYMHIWYCVNEDPCSVTSKLVKRVVVSGMIRQQSMKKGIHFSNHTDEFAKGSDFSGPSFALMVTPAGRNTSKFSGVKQKCFLCFFEMFSIHFRYKT